MAQTLSTYERRRPAQSTLHQFVLEHFEMFRAHDALNLNVHIHALVLDGVCAKDGPDTVRFHPSPRLTRADVAGVVWPAIRVVDTWAEDATVLAGIRPRPCKAHLRRSRHRAASEFAVERRDLVLPPEVGDVRAGSGPSRS